MKAAERAPIARIVDLMAAGLGPVTLTVGKGEIVGLTGLIGSGFDRVCAAAYGAVPAMRGVLELDRGQSLQSIALPSIEPPRSIDAGVAYLPADRLGAAGVGGFSVVENEMLPMLERMRGRFGLDRRRMMRDRRELGAEFNVKPNAPFLPLMALSGGNQQKALMAKWLQTKPQLILLDEPTQGVDVGARQQLLAALDGASLEGAGILIASTDWEQLAQICHRVIVFAHGGHRDGTDGRRLNEETIAECCYHSMTRIALICTRICMLRGPVSGADRDAHHAYEARIASLEAKLKAIETSSAARPRQPASI